MGLRPVAGAYHKDEKQLAELHARISQETFDEAVQENVETFDMSPEEALADAIHHVLVESLGNLRCAEEARGHRCGVGGGR